MCVLGRGGQGGVVLGVYSLTRQMQQASQQQARGTSLRLELVDGGSLRQKKDDDNNTNNNNSHNDDNS